MMYNDKGVQKKMLILDAAYRVRGKTWGAYGTDLSLTNYTNSWFYLGSWNTSTSTNVTNSKTLTDDAINSGMPFRDTNTARANTNVIMTVSDTQAAHWCREKTIDGTGCDLPNIQQLVRIYCDALFIDSLDPTVAGNPTLSLGRSDGIFGNNYAWSSTEYGSNNAWFVYYNGNVGGNYKYDSLAVVPILEV